MESEDKTAWDTEGTEDGINLYLVELWAKRQANAMRDDMIHASNNSGYGSLATRAEQTKAFDQAERAARNAHTLDQFILMLRREYL